MCTRLLYESGAGSFITARSMDWYEDLGSDLWFYPKGMKRDGGFGPGSVAWASTYGSVTLSGYDVGTADGMNEAGLVANNILSNEVNLDADSIFVKREVVEEESVAPAAGFKRPKLELDNLVAEQLLDYKDGSYLVKWVGLPKEQSTWQPAQNLDCAQLVHQFHTSK